MHVDRVMQSKK